MIYRACDKLENSGEKHEKRFKPEVIKFFNSLPNSIFKFVISKVKDFEDLERSYLSFVNSKKVYLMPAGENRIQLNKTRKVAIGLCKKYAFHYSERLHIVIWNKKTGV